MNEDFLHYVWKFQKFHTKGLATSSGEAIQIRKVGRHNTDSGPDFLCAEVVIGNQLWAGMVELHLRSSLWFAHGHETDSSYDNVILHVVWEHDMDIYRSDNSIIPTLELNDRVQLQVLAKYQGLFFRKKMWIYCENEFAYVDPLVLRNGMDRLFLERLEQKTEWITSRLSATQNDWEALLFQMLCKNFGLKVNGTSFESLALSVPYSVVKKCRQRLEDMEALLMGQARLFENLKEDAYMLQLAERYAYIKLKFDLSNDGVEAPRFFRLRPPGFPTVRLAQLAALWCKRPHLFSELLAAKSVQDHYVLLQVSAGKYWDSHYNFGVASVTRQKKLSKPFMDLLIINTALPMKHIYAQWQAKDVSEEIIALASKIKAEQNSVVKKFKSLRQIDNSALESQALLQLKKNYCDKKKCLQCAVGNALLRK